MNPFRKRTKDISLSESPFKKLISGKIHRKKASGGQGDKDKRAVGRQGDKAKKRFNGIRKQLTLGLAVPLLCLIIIGVISYYQAASGLTKNYEVSTANSLEMAATYLDYGFKSITSNGIQVSSDSSISDYFKGAYDDNPAQLSSVPPNINQQMPLLLWLMSVQMRFAVFLIS
ncbi:MAG TPA: hypothetical protein VN258_14665 [Mobilitalea sp.]|nr:hypothetical protein [Mobilitalea sp.]